MKEKLLSPDYLFEVSWEVCNKVGGIYTVISTKALHQKAMLGRRHIMVGPDVWMQTEDNPDFIEDPALYRNWKAKAAEEGIRVRIGRWNVPGKPVAILVDYKQFLPKQDQVLAEYWKRFGVDSLTGNWDYKENALFGYAAGRVIVSFYRYNLYSTDKVVAQFHEWQTGAGLLYIKDAGIPVATVFTTHATMMGRCICGNNLPLYKHLEGYDRAVIPGFYGAKKDGTVTTFSRGGSDVTGSVIAGAIHADLYENWTDVSGFLFTDPHVVENPEVVDTITYLELRELAYMGATVMHEDAIFPVRREGIPINIKNTNRPQDHGTMIVSSTCKKPKYTITGIAGKKGFCSINIDKDQMNSEIGFGRRVLQVFEDNNISFEHMPSGIDTMTIIVHQSEFMDHEQQIVAGIHRAVHPDSIVLESGLALIAVVGRGMKDQRGTAARLFAALSHARVNVKMIDQGSSEFNIIVGVKESDFETAIRAIYNIFVLTQI